MISVNIEGLDSLIRRLEALPPELVSKRGGVVRGALRKSAVIVQKEAQQNVRALVQDGETQESTGLLEKSLIVSRRKPGRFKGERYSLRIRRSAKNDKGVSANTYGGVLEFGDSRIPAKGWMRRAFEAKKAQALSTFTDELGKGIKRIEKKLSRMP